MNKPKDPEELKKWLLKREEAAREAKMARDVVCPRCGAQKGESCFKWSKAYGNTDGKRFVRAHVERVQLLKGRSEQ